MISDSILSFSFQDIFIISVELQMKYLFHGIGKTIYIC